MRFKVNLEWFSDACKVRRFLGLIAFSSLAGCTTPSPPPLTTPETFEAVACEDLVRFKYDRKVELLKLSDRLQRARAAASRGSSGSDGLSQLGDSIANLGHRMRINEIRDEVTAIRVEVAAIDYNLSNRCQQQTSAAAPREPPTDVAVGTAGPATSDSP